MTTDFNYGNTTITSEGPFKPKNRNVPMNARYRVETYADIATIPVPAVGELVFVLSDENNNNQQNIYVIKSLKASNLGVADSLVDEVVPLKTFLGTNDINLSDYVTEDELMNLIPNKTSDLVNDSNFISSNDEIDADKINGKTISEPMTKEEYDAITPKDTNTIYLVEDDIPEYSSNEANKVLAVNSNGDSLEWISVANIGTGGGDNTVVETPSSGTFDTEITLPFTASITTDVQLTFTPGVIESSNTITPTNINVVDSWDVTLLSEGEYVLESTIFGGKNCIHFTNNKGGTSYSVITSKGETLLDQTHKYFQICDIYLVSDGDNVNYPKIYGANAFTDTAIPIGEWKRFKEITSPTNSTQKATFRFFLDGEAYFTCCLVDLTVNNMETKTLEELEQMYNQGSFGTVTEGEFSCIINANGEEIEIEPFTSGTITKVVEVMENTTISITENGNYYLPNVTAMINNSDSDIQLDDVDTVINTRFRGKKAVFEGDSITDFDYHPKYEGKSWASYVANKLKLGSVLNPAQGGASISTFNATNSVVTRITTTNYEPDVKLFVVFAGTNDWGEGVALGDVDSTDTATVCGALNTIIDAIQTKCPEAEIVIISPMHRYADRTAVNSVDYKLGDIAPKYKEICDNWGVHFFNGFNVGINAYNETNRSLYYVETSAWLHPSKKGHKRMACNIAGYIATL